MFITLYKIDITILLISLFIVIFHMTLFATCTLSDEIVIFSIDGVNDQNYLINTINSDELFGYSKKFVYNLWFVSELSR